MCGSWQTYFNIGGIAGVLALVWQIITFALEKYRKPRLKCQDFIQSRDIFSVEWDVGDATESRRFVTIIVKNIGRRYARGCVANATATPISGEDSPIEAPLHWADLPCTYRTTGNIPIDIAPGEKRRLDIAFSRSDHEGCCIASHSGMFGNFYGDSKLDVGEYQVKVVVTFDDGNVSTIMFRLFSSKEWYELNAQI